MTLGRLLFWIVAGGLAVTIILFFVYLIWTLWQSIKKGRGEHERTKR